MVDTRYGTAVKNLFQEYYKRNISVGEYRAQRRKIIDQMDEEFNGINSMESNKSSSNDTSQ